LNKSRKKPDPSLSTFGLIRRLVAEHVRPHGGRIGLAMVFMAVTALTTAINVRLLEPAIDLVIVGQDKTMLWLIPVAVVIIAVFDSLATYGQSVLMAIVGQRIIGDIQNRLYAHIVRADLAFMHQHHTGKLTSIFVYDTSLLRDALSRALTGLVKDSLTALFLIAVMFMMDWQLTLGTLIVLPLVGLFVRKIGRRMKKASTAGQIETGRLNALLTETFEGARLIKAYGMERYETGRVADAVERRLVPLFKAVRIRAGASPITGLLAGIAVALAFFYGGWKSGMGALTAGQFAAFIAALLASYRPLKSLANLNASLHEGLAAAERVFDLIDTPPEVAEKPGAAPLVVRRGEIRFDNVTFSYTGDAAALDNVCLTVPAGQTVALVGPSGAGKSTVLNLIPRFYDVESGAVRIDGMDVRDATTDSLRAALALVSQETTLFDDTVRANIAYGRPGATNDELVAAAQAAAAHDFILDLPQGYDTVVGESGAKLSGGQRQRIAIARAMLRNAPILLLDEATSSLDSESEQQIQEALRSLIKGRTTLVIAHRLSTVKEADCIHVMDKGRVVESGTHQELLVRGGLYARLYALQFSDEPERIPAAVRAEA